MLGCSSARVKVKDELLYIDGCTSGLVEREVGRWGRFVSWGFRSARQQKHEAVVGNAVWERELGALCGGGVVLRR